MNTELFLQSCTFRSGSLKMIFPYERRTVDQFWTRDLWETHRCGQSVDVWSNACIQVLASFLQMSCNVQVCFVSSIDFPNEESFCCKITSCLEPMICCSYVVYDLMKDQNVSTQPLRHEIGKRPPLKSEQKTGTRLEGSWSVKTQFVIAILSRNRVLRDYARRNSDVRNPKHENNDWQ